MPNLALDALDPDLLAVLACPDTDHAPLRLSTGAPGVAAGGSSLTCTGCGRSYDIVDGIPVLLLDRGHPAGGPSVEEAGHA